MGFRLKTSKRTMEIFDYLERRTFLKPYTLSKLSISLSLRYKENIEKFKIEDKNGLELNRQTIMGEYDNIFKCLMEVDLGRSLSDDEYFPYYSKCHLDRGAILLKNSYDYNGSFRYLFESLLRMD